MYRTLVIIRYTFLEAVLQPIYALLLTLGAAILFIFALLPFFTLGEDTKMFLSVALDVILLLVLLATLFATSKSIYEEIEDRTMLTLMSKPVRRWEVMIGKYLGIILSAAMGVAILGAVVILGTWVRIPTDNLMNANSLNDVVREQIWNLRLMHIMGLLPQLVLTWLQISVLAAVGVALSTRFSLVVNLPTVIILYLAGNLTRFLLPIAGGPLGGKPEIVQILGRAVALVLPYLGTFDLKDVTVLSTVKIGQFSRDVRAISLGPIWAYVGIATLYAIAYCTFVLSAGMWSFQRRELGGGEG
ncbi:MAG TPA: ABC transporter permease subunit [Tepidisphaeraceae bacterium]|jgi:ABC-type transport system involved in multi-copper enzyme maturation permease subunit|nr:ABC transporter permease subunit [Tepidisphaeraceae bacterium]